MVGRALQDSMDLSLAWPISNSNWTEWSTIQGVIARVISKSGEREADLKLRARLLPELHDMRSNYSLIVSITNFGIKNVF